MPGTELLELGPKEGPPSAPQGLTLGVRVTALQAHGSSLPSLVSGKPD